MNTNTILIVAGLAAAAAITYVLVAKPSLPLVTGGAPAPTITQGLAPAEFVAATEGRYAGQSAQQVTSNARSALSRLLRSPGAAQASSAGGGLNIGKAAGDVQKAVGTAKQVYGQVENLMKTFKF